MQLNIKPFLFILGSLILLFGLFACLQNLFFERLIIDWTLRHEGVMKTLVLVTFLVFSAAAVPVCLKLFLFLQHQAGNGELPLVKLISQNAMKLVYAAWIIFGLGLGVALPVMIKDGFLSTMK